MSLKSEVQSAIAMLKGANRKGNMQGYARSGAPSPYARPLASSKPKKVKPAKSPVKTSKPKAPAKVSKPKTSPKTPKVSSKPKAPVKTGFTTSARSRRKASPNPWPVTKVGVQPDKHRGKEPAAARKKVQPSAYPGASKPAAAKPAAPKPPTSSANKKLNASSKKAIRQNIKTSSQKMVYHMKQAARLKTSGASESGHAKHSQYMGHLKNIQAHKQTMATHSRALAQHVSTKGGKGKQIAGGMSSAISRMRY